MAFGANNFCPVLTDVPQVGLVAIHAIQAFLYMELVLPDGNLIAMALAGAGGRGWNDLTVGFVALVTEQARHGAFPGNSVMAFDTPVLRYHGRRLF